MTIELIRNSPDADRDIINKKRKGIEVRTWLSLIMSYEGNGSAMVFDWIKSNPNSAEIRSMSFKS